LYYGILKRFDRPIFISLKEDALRVGPYVVRAPASSSRLEVAQDGLLKYLAKGWVPNDRCDSLFEAAGQIYDYLEWIARVTCHIPEKGAQTIRYCGACSNSHRGKMRKRAAQQQDPCAGAANTQVEPDSDWVKQSRRSWAALLRLVYEVDPLLCPNCHSQMKILSVIKDGKVIDKILDHLQYNFQPLPLASARPPPHPPPEWDSFSAD